MTLDTCPFWTSVSSHIKYRFGLDSSWQMSSLWASFSLAVMFAFPCASYRASQVVLVVKNPPANAGDMRDAGSISESDSLEEEMGIHPSIPAWRSPWTEEPGGPQSTVSQRAGHFWSDLACMHVHYTNQTSWENLSLVLPKTLLTVLMSLHPHGIVVKNGILSVNPISISPRMKSLFGHHGSSL